MMERQGDPISAAPYPTSLFPTAQCTDTLGSLDARWRVISPNGFERITVPIMPLAAVAALCPANCSRVAAARLFGSFPYHGQSSVCLAAVHAGIIDDSVGGGVFVSRFYRHDWSNSSTQSIFPFTSAMGTLSNGVHSRDVDSSWYTVPSNASEWSYSVRGRGDYVVQRREAPFSPRAGHVHLSFHRLSIPHSFNVHLIVGGRNATHYLNDVWLAQQPIDTVIPDIDWRRMPDAPFTPRSDMSMRAEGDWEWTSRSDPVVHIVGGQTAHRCGRVELGVCSDEVWRLRVVVVDNTTVTAYWSTTSVFHLPFSPRCQPAVILASTRPESPTLSSRLFLLGGQLSYNDSTCSSPPITVNDVWAAEVGWVDGVPVSEWTLQSAAPFSPRRLDMACHVGDSFHDEGVEPCNIGGGIRYTNVTRVREGQARLVRAELSAEVWACFVNTTAAQPWQCRWGQQSVGNASLLSSTLAAPSAGGVETPRSYSYTYSEQLHDNLAFGGWHPPSFLQQWANTRPVLDQDVLPEDYDWSEVAVNVSMVGGLLAVVGDASVEQLMELMMGTRAGLPLTAAFSEEELNDEAGVYAMGSEWTAVAVPVGTTVLQGPAFSTLHPQPTAFASHPNQSTVYMPQAASSLNTTRPRFNFPLRRHSHRSGFIRSSLQAYLLLSDLHLKPFILTPSHHSGGQSGSTFYSDWIQTVKARCLPPIDPSFLSTLGPVTLIITDLTATQVYYTLDSFPTATDHPLPLTVACQSGHHFEPPSRDTWRPLICAPNGVWMDADILSIRRCVKDRLRCDYPLADVGGLWCEPVLPVIREVRAKYVDATGASRSAPSVDVVTLVELPVTGGVSLSLYGNAFFLPLQVLVGSVRCDNPTLQSTPALAVSSVWYNISLDAPGQSTLNASASAQLWPQLVRGEYGQLIVCTLPTVVGVDMVVWLSSGRMGEVTEVDAAVTARLSATLTTAPPTLTRISSAACTQLSPYPSPASSPSASSLNLIACPIRHPFNLTVCASIDTVGLSPAQWTSGVTVVLATHTNQLTLPCTPFGAMVLPLPSVAETCAVCMAMPGLTEWGVALHRPAVGQVSEQSGLLTFSQCPAGTRQDWAAAGARGWDVCQTCPLGTSTEGAEGSDRCQPCAAGHSSNTTGAATCSPCTPGTYAALPGADACAVCPANSYSNATAQTRCETCELNTYIVYEPQVGGGQVARVRGSCVRCPGQAECDANGTIAAAAGEYLLIEQNRGMVQSITCSKLACTDGSVCLASTSSAQRQLVAISQLHVSNCCDDGRWPAYLDNEQLYAHLSAAMQRDHGHNVLCAQCLPHYSQVNGRCIACSATNWPALLGLLALALLAVYLIHRLPHDWTGSATLLITSNFLQLSTLFLASSSMPQLLSLFSVNLLGSHTAKGQGTATPADGGVSVCVVPLSDSDRIVVALVSPALALALLCAVVAIQLALRRWMTMAHSDVQLEGGEGSESARTRLYRWLCVPSAAKLPSLRPVLGLSEPLRPSSWESEHVEEQQTPPSSLWDGEVRPRAAPPSLSLAFLRTMVRLLQLSYTSLTAVTLAFFHLQDVGEFGQRVVDYPTLSPDSAEYGHLYPVMVVLLCVVVCGAPVTLFLYLLHYHRTGRLAEMEQLHNLRAASAGQEWGGSSSSSTMSARCAVVVQLTVMYRPGCWWMAAFVLLRRLLCIALLTVVRSSAVWSWLTLLGYSLLALHMQQQPYVRLRDNQLETLTLLSLSVQTSLLSLYPPPYLSPLLLAAFNALVIGPLLPPLLSALNASCRRAMSQWEKRERSRLRG